MASIDCTHKRDKGAVKIGFTYTHFFFTFKVAGSAL